MSYEVAGVIVGIVVFSICMGVSVGVMIWASRNRGR